VNDNELVRALIELRPEWIARREHIEQAMLFDGCNPNVGTDLAHAVFAGQTDAWIAAAFELIERALQSNPEHQLVDDLIEWMQDIALREAEPPDVLDAAMGPLLKRAWTDKIGQCTGGKAHSIADWRRVVVNVEVVRVAFTSEALQFVASAEGIEWQRGGGGEVGSCDVGTPVAEIAKAGETTPFERGPRRATREGELARIGEAVRPLMAVRVIERGEFGDMHAMIDLDAKGGPKLVMIGRAVDGGRIARCGERWYVIDYDALVAQWQFVTG